MARRVVRQRRRTVFLVGEGKGDIGGLALDPAFRDETPGYVQAVVERLAGVPLRFKGQKLTALPRERLKRPRDIHVHRARMAARLAEYEEADALVIVTDVDSEPGRSGQRAAEKRMDRLRRSLHQGVEAAATDVPAVVGTPLRTIEAWALGDPAAVQVVARRHRPVVLPKPPEQLWGDRRDRRSNHPKWVLHRQFSNPPDHVDYAEIGSKADLASVERNCPMSFAPFAAAIREVL